MVRVSLNSGPKGGQRWGCSNSFGEAVPLRDGAWEQGLLLELGPVEGHVKGTGVVGVVITSWSQVFIFRFQA